jgi:hypothetical protein
MNNAESSRIELRAYFDKPDTPSPKSPVAILMFHIIEKYPELNFEAAQVKAHELLAVAAKAKNYRLPAVYSATELAARAERFKTAFGRGKAAAQDAPQTTAIAFAV